MSIVSLENNYLSVQINTHGAEIVSIKQKKDDYEFIWQGNKESWDRHAPVLFPIVGRLNNDHYSVDGKEYTMNQHGFARDADFDIEDQTSVSVTLELSSSKVKTDNYPFKFELYITYILSNQKLLVNYRVFNPDDKEMYFSIGGHPGFNLDGNYEDYEVEMISVGKKKQYHLNDKGQVDVDDFKPIEDRDIKFNVNHELFKNDALIYELSNPMRVTVDNAQTDYKIVLESDNNEFVGIWSSYPHTDSFICIEPWWGIADTNENDGDLKDKYGIHKLDRNQDFDASYSMEFQK